MYSWPSVLVTFLSLEEYPGYLQCNEKRELLGLTVFKRCGPWLVCLDVRNYVAEGRESGKLLIGMAAEKRKSRGELRTGIYSCNYLLIWVKHLLPTASMN